MLQVSLLLILVILTLTHYVIAGPLAAINLRTEYVTHMPLIDDPAPRFFWIPEHTDRGASSSAYQIIVIATDSLGTKNVKVWDSGKVMSTVNGQVAYAGTPLTSDTIYTWTVTWWDQNGNSAPISNPANFSTGLMTQAEWAPADFITCPQPGPTPYNQLRTEFSIPTVAGATIVQARLCM
jgi:alpha-L-rhamnosidase